MATSTPEGFTYYRGPFETFMSTISSTATFRKGAPVTFSDDRSLIEANSDTTAVVGIAMHNAANSIYPGKALVQRILPGTQWLVKAETDLATSATSAGEGMGLIKSGNNFIVGDDSALTNHVTILTFDDGSTVRSSDSALCVAFNMDYVWGSASNASVNIFAQD